MTVGAAALLVGNGGGKGMGGRTCDTVPYFFIICSFGQLQAAAGGALNTTAAASITAAIAMDDFKTTDLTSLSPADGRRPT